VEQAIKSKYPNLYGKSTGTGKKLSHILDEYGWLNSIYDIAIDGIFTKSWKYSAVESVEETEVWDVLTYMSWKSANQEYKNKYQELEHKKMKQKN
jgi:hypothetical protein|tara:strand:+ start:13151 stop:13435 length:285 start_codon:yes stop_codon:yes gene_type:complete